MKAKVLGWGRGEGSTKAVLQSTGSKPGLNTYGVSECCGQE